MSSLFFKVANGLAEASARRANKIKAYHGSPHSFDRFSTESIGTGEGAQAYGRGLYFAEREATALSYRDALTPRDLDYEEDLMRKYNAAESNGDYARMEMLERAMTHDTPSDFRDLASDTDYDEDYRQLASDMADEIESTGTNFGSMYEVEIDVEDADLLNWDVPLDEQPQKVQDALRKTDWYEDAEARAYESAGNRGDNPYGADLLRDLEEDGPEFAAEALREAGILGVKYADALTRFSKNKTNNYVIFNDEYVDIARKYGIGAASTLGAAAALSPQDAEAGGLASAMHVGQRIIDLGMLKQASIDNPRAIKLATNKYEKLMKQNPAFADRERQAYAGGFDTIFTPGELPPRKIISPESLLGKTITPVRGDRSDIGVLSQVGGQKVDVNVQGGNKFNQQNGGWASAEGIARGQHNKHIAAQEDTQKDVIGVYNAMGEESVNFSTPIADGMFQQIPALTKIDKTDINRFDDEIRKTEKKVTKKDKTVVVTYPFKDWVGMDHPDAMSQIMGKDGYPKFGALRTQLTATMGKAHYRDRGFPSYNEMIKSTEDPALSNAAIGDSGLQTYKVDTSQDVQPIDFHDTYSHRMPGENTGGLEESLPFEIFFPKSYEKFRNTKTRSGKLMSHDQAIVAMNIRKDGYEVADQKWLDGVMKYKKEIAAGTVSAGVAGSASAAEETSKPSYIDGVIERGAGILDAGANIVSGAVTPIIQGLQHMGEMGTPNPDGSTKSLAQLKARDSELNGILNYDLRTESGKQITDDMLQGVADAVNPAFGALDEGLRQADNILPGQPYQQAKDSAGALYDWFNKQDEKTRMHIGKLMDILP